MVSIARKNLFEDIPRFLVAQAGIVFAVSLVTIQMGILKGFNRSTVLLIESSAADLWVASEEMENLELTVPFPLEHVTQAQQVPGVERAEALVIRAALWRSHSGKIAPVRVIGFDPQGQLFGRWPLIEGQQRDLHKPYTVLIDQTNLRILDVKQVGDTAEVSTLPAQVVGLTQETQSLASSAFLFASLENANAYVNSPLNPTLRCQFQDGTVSCSNTYNESSNTADPAPVPRRLSAIDPISYVLVRARPGEDLQALKQRLEAAIPKTRVYTRSEMAARTRNFWQQRTGIGFILSLGTAVGVVVGTVIVSQILYASVSDHLKEFGTLKAIGASNWVIYRVIIEQALWMSVLGYLPGMTLCLALGAWTSATQGVVILVTPTIAAGVFTLTVVMCVGAAFFAIQKVTQVDPVMVFKA